METTETLDLQADTLSGDIRDSFLTILRDQQKPFAQLGERDQRNVNAAIDQLARDTVRRAVNLVADRGFVHVACSYNKATLADGIKIELTAPRVSTIGAILGERPPGPALLVFCDAEDFIGERAPAGVEKDQPDLPMHDGDGVVLDDSVDPDAARTMLDAAPSLKGTAVKLSHFWPDQHDEIRALVLAKGGKILDESEPQAPPAPARASGRKRQIAETEAA